MVSIRLRRWTKKLNTDGGGHGFGFFTVFLGGEGYWIYLWISVDSRVLGALPFT